MFNKNKFCAQFWIFMLNKCCSRSRAILYNHIFKHTYLQQKQNISSSIKPLLNNKLCMLNIKYTQQFHPKALN